MSNAAQTQTLEQSLNKTDFGHMIYENRKIFFALLIAIFVGISGYVLWKQSKKSQAEAVSFKVFDFQSKTWKGTKEGKVSEAELIKKFMELDSEVQKAPVMVPLALEMGKFLYDKGALNEAESILSKVNTDHFIAAYFVSSQRAVILEKLNKIPEAIAVLEKIAKDKEGYMAARVNLELGRLNLLNGEKGKAQTHLEYVISTFPNDEEAKVAKLYMAKLAQ
jgi:predicted negative regulator of RcsB-dependent stress response